VLVLPKINLSLNFKKTQKNYKFIVDKPIEVTEEVYEYLSKNYNNKFLKICPIVNTVTNIFEDSRNNLENSVIKDNNDILNQLVDFQNESKQADIKIIIEKAIEQNVIVKNGAYYKIEDQMCKGLNKVKSLLEKDTELLNKVSEKIN